MLFYFYIFINQFYFLCLTNYYKRSRFLKTYPFLLSLLKTTTSKPIVYLPLTRDNGCELAHHIFYMVKALKNNLVYCPSASGYPHDGCLYDSARGLIVEAVQFKTRLASGPVNYSNLISHIDKYNWIDNLMLGFIRTEDHKINSPLINKLNEIQLANGAKLKITSEDFSMLVDGVNVNVPLLKDSILNQVEHNKLVLSLNKNMKEELIKSGYSNTSGPEVIEHPSFKCAELIDPSFNCTELIDPVFLDCAGLELITQTSSWF